MKPSKYQCKKLDLETYLILAFILLLSNCCSCLKRIFNQYPTQLFFKLRPRKPTLLRLKRLFSQTYYYAFLIHSFAVYVQSVTFFSILLTHEGSHREVYLDFHLPKVVPRVVQTTGSVHPQPTLPNCYLFINTEPTTSIGRLIKSSRL